MSVFLQHKKHSKVVWNLNRVSNRMVIYTVRFYTGSYKSRQLAANSDGAICYIEHHLNSFADPSAGYASVLITERASRLCRDWAESYIRSVATELSVPLVCNEGVVVLSSDDRGYGNLCYARIPSMIPEPLFVSNPVHAEMLQDGDAVKKLAEILAISIRDYFPNGGLVAFSVGHRYKGGANMDEGAPVVGGGTEAEFAERILRLSAMIITEGDLSDEQEEYTSNCDKCSNDRS